MLSQASARHCTSTADPLYRAAHIDQQARDEARPTPFWAAPSTGSVLDRYAALASTRRTDPTRTRSAKREAIVRQQERRAKQEVRRG